MATTNRALDTVPSNSLQPSVPINADLAILDAAIYGITSVEFSADSNRTLTVSECDCSVLLLTDSPATLTTGRDVVFPDRFPMMLVQNDTAQTLTLKKTGQAGVALPAGGSATVAAGDSDVVAVSGGSSDAEDVAYDNATSGLTATDVQAAIDELAAGGGGTLANFNEAANTSAPNTTVPVVSLAATNAATNVDVAIVPKGTGGIAAHIADSTSAGGNKRGASAVDLQSVRTTAAQVASGTQSVVGGGANNTASQANCTIAGGVSNTASAAYATVTGGNTNAASGQYSTAGGRSNTASGTESVALGHTNTASAAASTAIGRSNTANGTFSLATGAFANARSIVSSSVHGAASGRQRTEVPIYKNTTDATPAVLTSDGGAAAATNQYALSSGMAACIRIQVIARQTAGSGTGDCKAWVAEALLKNISGTTSLVAAVTPVVVAEDAGATAWALAITADNTTDALAVTVTGEASKTIQWTARVIGVDA